MAENENAGPSPINNPLDDQPRPTPKEAEKAQLERLFAFRAGLINYAGKLGVSKKTDRGTWSKVNSGYFALLHSSTNVSTLDYLTKNPPSERITQLASELIASGSADGHAINILRAKGFSEEQIHDFMYGPTEDAAD